MEIILGYFLLVAILWFCVELKTYIDQNVARLCYLDAERKLSAWKATRPFLYYGTCPYARSLIITMIDSYKILLLTGYTSNERHLDFLYTLLERFPPTSGPPRAGLSFWGGCARIGALRKEVANNLSACGCKTSFHPLRSE